MVTTSLPTPLDCHKPISPISNNCNSTKRATPTFENIHVSKLHLNSNPTYSNVLFFIYYFYNFDAHANYCIINLSLNKYYIVLLYKFFLNYVHFEFHSV